MSLDNCCREKNVSTLSNYLLLLLETSISLSLTSISLTMSNIPGGGGT